MLKRLAFIAAVLAAVPSFPPGEARAQNFGGMFKGHGEQWRVNRADISNGELMRLRAIEAEALGREAQENEAKERAAAEARKLPPRPETPEEREQRLDREYEATKAQNSEALRQLRFGRSPSLQHEMNREEATLVLELFRPAVEKMRRHSDEFDTLKRNFQAPPEYSGTRAERLTSEINYTNQTLVLVRATRVNHRKMGAAAYDASQWSPEAVRSLEWLAGRFRANGKDFELDESRTLRQEMARRYEDQARELKRTGVTLPSGFAEMGRHLEENIRLMMEVRDALEMERRLPSQIRELSDLHRENVKAFRRYYRAWIEDELKPWQEKMVPQWSGADPRSKPVTTTAQGPQEVAQGEASLSVAAPSQPASNLTTPASGIPSGVFDGVAATAASAWSWLKWLAKAAAIIVLAIIALAVVGTIMEARS